MTNYNTILCPIDFSDCSRAARDTALDLARQLNASLWLVHVLEPQTLLGLDAGMATAAATLMEVQLETARRLVSGEVQQCQEAQAGAAVRGDTQVGLAASTIVALSEDADMIVMGTHGRTGLKHVVLGSVAERVVRLAKCPVLTVHEPHSSAD